VGREVQSFAGADHTVEKMMSLRSLHTMASTFINATVRRWAAGLHGDVTQQGLHSN